MGRRTMAGVLCAALLSLLAAGLCYGHRESIPELRLGNGLFSWQSAALDPEERQALFARMTALGLSDLYQHIPKDTPPAAVEEFLLAASRAHIAVYLLTGSPEWGLDERGEAMCAEVRRAALYNENLAKEAHLRGVMMDVEPYQNQIWQGDADGVMAAYVEGMRLARAECERYGLSYIACVPYFYDILDQTARLQELVQEGCHGLAVMNYHKSDEAGHLATEAALAKAAGKPLVTIYELQAPGTHALKESNTYYHDGLSAVRESFAALKGQLDCPQFSYALHHDEALREVLERE